MVEALVLGSVVFECKAGPFSRLLFSPDLYEQHRKEHYIKNVQVDRPAVISVNGYVAYMAVLNLLDRIIGYRHEPKYGQLVSLLCDDEVVKRPEDEFPVDPYLAKYKGRGDCNPYLNMPSLG